MLALAKSVFTSDDDCHATDLSLTWVCQARKGPPEFVAGMFPKLSKSSLGDYPHPSLLLLSASQGILVRKIRTGKRRVREMRTSAGKAGNLAIWHATRTIVSPSKLPLKLHHALVISGLPGFEKFRKAQGKRPPHARFPSGHRRPNE